MIHFRRLNYLFLTMVRSWAIIHTTLHSNYLPILDPGNPVPYKTNVRILSAAKSQSRSTQQGRVARCGHTIDRLATMTVVYEIMDRWNSMVSFAFSTSINNQALLCATIHLF